MKILARLEECATSGKLEDQNLIDQACEELCHFDAILYALELLHQLDINCCLETKLVNAETSNPASIMTALRVCLDKDVALSLAQRLEHLEVRNPHHLLDCYISAKVELPSLLERFRELIKGNHQQLLNSTETLLRYRHDSKRSKAAISILMADLELQKQQQPPVRMTMVLVSSLLSKHLQLPKFEEAFAQMAASNSNFMAGADWRVFRELGLMLARNLQFEKAMAMFDIATNIHNLNPELHQSLALDYALAQASLKQLNVEELVNMFGKHKFTNEMAIFVISEAPKDEPAKILELLNLFPDEENPRWMALKAQMLLKTCRDDVFQKIGAVALYRSAFRILEKNGLEGSHLYNKIVRTATCAIAEVGGLQDTCFEFFRKLKHGRESEALAMVLAKLLIHRGEHQTYVTWVTYSCISDKRFSDLSEFFSRLSDIIRPTNKAESISCLRRSIEYLGGQKQINEDRHAELSMRLYGTLLSLDRPLSPSMVVELDTGLSSLCAFFLGKYGEKDGYYKQCLTMHNQVPKTN